MAIVGQVGSGKSSMINAMLGEMIKHQGTINTKVCTQEILLSPSTSFLLKYCVSKRLEQENRIGIHLVG